MSTSDRSEPPPDNRLVYSRSNSGAPPSSTMLSPTPLDGPWQGYSPEPSSSSHDSIDFTTRPHIPTAQPANLRVMPLNYSPEHAYPTTVSVTSGRGPNTRTNNVPQFSGPSGPASDPQILARPFPSYGPANNVHLGVHPSQGAEAGSISLSTSYPPASNLRMLQCRWEGCIYHGSFRRDNDLWRHIWGAHLAPRSFVCAVGSCRVPFNRKDNLQEHIRRRHT